MTQEDFNKMMDIYLQDLSKRNPSQWSGNARMWAEDRAIISGDSSGNKAYKKFATREEVAQMIYRAHSVLKDASVNETSKSYLSELSSANEQMKTLNAMLNNNIDNVELSDQLNSVNNALSTLYTAIQDNNSTIRTNLNKKLELINSKIVNIDKSLASKELIEAIDIFNEYMEALKLSDLL